IRVEGGVDLILGGLPQRFVQCDIDARRRGWNRGLVAAGGRSYSSGADTAGNEGCEKRSEEQFHGSSSQVLVYAAARMSASWRAAATGGKVCTSTKRGLNEWGD